MDEKKVKEIRARIGGRRRGMRKKNDVSAKRKNESGGVEKDGDEKRMKES